MLKTSRLDQINFIELQSNHIIYGNLEQDKGRFKKQPHATVSLKDTNSLSNILSDVQSQLTTNRPKILFFIHGWWESKPSHMAECIEYLKSTFIDDRKSTIGAVVFLTWNASYFSYKAAQKEALRVVPNFRFLLESIYLFQSQNGISCNLMSHSLGNFILYHALNEEKQVFDKLLMSAPDIPILSNRNKVIYKRIEKVADRILLLRNTKDRSLLSSGIVNGRKRLGRIGFPRNYKGTIKTKDIHDFEDVKDFKGRLTNHIHYRTSPKTIKLAFEFFMTED